MPKRSNEFQRLIYLVHRELHDRATVTESAMLADRLGGPAQEVDVLIEEPIGQIHMLIGVECRDRGRPATVEWVQQMRGKHQHRTDKLVLVSRSGFTGTAVDEARRHGIETMSLAEAREADWNVVVNKLKEVFVGQFSFNISKGYAVLDEEYGLTEAPEISAAEPLYSPDDELMGPVGGIARDQLQRPAAARELMELFYRNQDRAQATATFEVPAGSFLIDTSGMKWRVKAIRLEIECKMRMTPVALQHGVVGAVHVAWGQTAVGDELLFFATIEQPGQPGRTALRISQNGRHTEQIVDMTGETDS